MSPASSSHNSRKKSRSGSPGRGSAERPPRQTGPLPRPDPVSMWLTRQNGQVDSNGAGHLHDGMRGPRPSSGLRPDRHVVGKGGVMAAGPAASLIEAARAARLKAHAPFSHFLVGAALEGADGRVIT